MVIKKHKASQEFLGSPLCPVTVFASLQQAWQPLLTGGRQRAGQRHVKLNNLFSDVPEGLSLGTALSMCQGKKKKKKTQFSAYHPLLEGFPGGSDGEESAKWGRPGFDPWVGRICRSRAWWPTAVFLPGEAHGQRGLVDYGPWGYKELEMTEWLSLLFTHSLKLSKDIHSENFTPVGHRWMFHLFSYRKPGIGLGEGWKLIK